MVEKLNDAILEQLGVGPSFSTIKDTKIMKNRIRLSTVPIGNYD